MLIHQKWIRMMFFQPFPKDMIYLYVLGKQCLRPAWKQKIKWVLALLLLPFFLPVEHPVNGPESTVQCKRKFYVSEFCRD